MTTKFSETMVAQLQKCLELAADVKTQELAHQEFAKLRENLPHENPLMLQLLEMLWQDVIKSRRSASFWQHISDAEKGMSGKLIEDMTDMQQNYLRLMQEM